MPAVEPARPSFEVVTRGPVTPGVQETMSNPRSRSAKLRAVARTDAPAQEPMDALSILAELPDAGDRRGDRR
jgi:16S rRNA (cytosine1402-N4)-methyltransferase